MVVQALLAAIVALAHAVATWALVTFALVVYVLSLVIEGGYGFTALCVALAIWFGLAALLFAGWELGAE